MKKILTLFLISLVFASSPIVAQKKSKVDKAPAKTIASITDGMTKETGFLSYYWDDAKGKVMLEVNNLNQEFLYINSLAAGVGSNDIGLDRGQLGNRRVVKFEKHGPKLLLIQPNYDYRAVSDNQEEVRSVQEAFASSVIWGFKIEKGEGDTYLIDVTDFLLRDAHKVSDRLTRTKQGSYKLDLSRSALYRPNTMNFPMNTEFESTLTFTGKPTGDWVQSVVPSPDAVTVRMHHSLVQLPDDGYEPRKFDPRSGYNHISYQDYATPIASPLTKKYIARHRLQKKNPEAAMSEAVEPIVYYLDRGTPEPVRSALLDGAKWWNQAFEAAGFTNAFQVEIMPEGAHPMDVRYNVIQWVHRSTRGWSYGASVVDPRTGEIIKGHVSLGSLRVRQDFLIAQGLLNQYEEGDSPMIQLALARLRQLSAHEVGHTIGLVHSYASSTNDRASVMDYPHPTVKLAADGTIDLSDAYDVGIGTWDKVAITYGYAQYENEEVAFEASKKVLEDAFATGLKYITDRDARASDGAHPDAHLWDNGADPADELMRLLKIRRLVLDRLSEKSLPTGAPYSSLEEVMVPMYLFHRYQVDAASKLIGGLNYNYAVVGGNQVVTSWIPASRQLNALDALLTSVHPDHLILSDELLMKIPPKAHGFSRNRETFQSKTGPVWDYYTAAATATQLTTGFLLNPHRANRLAMYQVQNPEQPGLTTILEKSTKAIFDYQSTDQKKLALNRIVQEEFISELMKLAGSTDSQPDTKSIATMQLEKIEEKTAKLSPVQKSPVAMAHFKRLSQWVNNWMEDPEEVQYSPTIKAPDGSPIGSDDDTLLMNCSMDY
ncbi:MAG: hypothetical protein ACJAZM_002959 [Cyclobacteriaceae bacterium]|jgi:hypothetical protein